MKSISGIERHVGLNLSDKRFLFAVGDIHGEYSMLREKLQQVGFDEACDVLVSVGDLVDRGPESEEALEWIQKPWFYRVLGNHDVAPRMYLDGKIERYLLEENFGGAWLTSKPRHVIEDIAIKLKDAPVSLTILTPKGNMVGIVHADCLRDWNSQAVSLHKLWVYDLALWSRETIGKLQKLQESGQPFDPSAVAIANIDHVFSGHTILAEPFTCANRTWLDTGACMGGKLTVLNVDLWLDHWKQVK